MKEDLIINRKLIIPASELKISFIRSQGPGGQNVNKTSTAVQLRFNLSYLYDLEDETLDRIRNSAGSRLTIEDEIIIKSQKFRSQEKNLKEAYERLKTIITDGLKKPKKRKKTKPTAESGERRLKKKKITSEKKKLRENIKLD